LELSEASLAEANLKLAESFEAIDALQKENDQIDILKDELVTNTEKIEESFNT